jgi:hypothetical protein
VNVDALIAARRAELLATETGRNLTPDMRHTITPGELARRRDPVAVRRHGQFTRHTPKDEA